MRLEKARATYRDLGAKWYAYKRTELIVVSLPAKVGFNVEGAAPGFIGLATSSGAVIPFGNADAPAMLA